MVACTLVAVSAIAWRATLAEGRSSSLQSTWAVEQNDHRSARQDRGKARDESGLSAHDMISWLGDVELDILVEVVLVGFAGDGRKGISLDATTLSSHLDSLAASGARGGGVGDRRRIEGRSRGMPISVVDQSRENEVLPLELNQEILYHVTQGHPSLSKAVSQAVTSAIAANEAGAGVAEAMAGTGVGIPPSTVDRVVQAHHHGGSASYSIYLLHPDVQGRYWYTQSRRTGAGAGVGVDTDGCLGAKASESGVVGALPPAACPFIGWVGDRERYVWLDLRAGPVSWGPRTRAQGVVFPGTLPDVRAAAAAPAAASRGGAWAGAGMALLYPDLAAVVHRTALQLVAPLLVFTPGGMGPGFHPLTVMTGGGRGELGVGAGMARGDSRAEVVLVHLFLVCDMDPCPEEELQGWVGTLEQALGSAATTATGEGASLLPRVSVKGESIGALGSPLLAVGLQQSLRSSRGEPFAAPGAMSLDSGELRIWLRKFLEGRAVGKTKRQEGPGPRAGAEARAGAGVGVGGVGGAIHQGSDRVVPLFVISLEAETPLLLDHSMHSTALPDMVVSVTTRAGPGPSTFACGGHPVIDCPGAGPWGSAGTGGAIGSLARATVASLLQLVWGVQPRPVSWDPGIAGGGRGGDGAWTLGTDYLWAAGASMSTPLSSHSSPSFPERDSYPRSQLLRRVGAALNLARSILLEVAATEPDLSVALGPGDYYRAAHSWHQLQSDLGQCLSSLALHNFARARGLAGGLEVAVEELQGALTQGYGWPGGLARLSCTGTGLGEGGGGPPFEWGGAGRGSGKGTVVLVDRAGDVLFGMAVILLAIASWRYSRVYFRGKEKVG